MTIAKRLEELITYLGDNQKGFADRTGIDQRSISNAVNGKNIPSTTFLTNVLENIKGLNARWLLTGVGEMFAGEAESLKNTVGEQDQQFSRDNPKIVEMGNISTLAGCKEMVAILQERIQLKEELLQFKDSRIKMLEQQLEGR